MTLIFNFFSEGIGSGKSCTKESSVGMVWKLKYNSNDKAHDQSECMEGKINECLLVAQPETVSWHWAVVM